MLSTLFWQSLIMFWTYWLPSSKLDPCFILVYYSSRSASFSLFDWRSCCNWMIVSDENSLISLVSFSTSALSWSLSCLLSVLSLVKSDNSFSEYLASSFYLNTCISSLLIFSYNSLSWLSSVLFLCSSEWILVFISFTCYSTALIC